jgi:predicted site-specific integrase-resolvase
VRIAGRVSSETQKFDLVIKIKQTTVFCVCVLFRVLSKSVVWFGHTSTSETVVSLLSVLAARGVKRPGRVSEHSPPRCRMRGAIPLRPSHGLVLTRKLAHL